MSPLYLTYPTLLLGVISLSIISEAEREILGSNHLLPGSIYALTQKQLQALLAPIKAKNGQPRGPIGRFCNYTTWERTLKPFITNPMNINQYLLESNSDWQDLIFALYNSTLNSRRNTNKTSLSSLVFAASEEICFTGGPFTVCAQNNQCRCNEKNYIERGGTCLGKIHAYCGLGIPCDSGLRCVQTCWGNSLTSNCSSNSRNSNILGYCGGKDDLYFEFRRRIWAYKRFEFFMQGVIVSAVSVFGIVGNCLSVLILTRPQLRSTMSYVLLGMSICDFVFLMGQFLSTGIDYSISYFSMTKEAYVYMGDDDDGETYFYSLLQKWSYYFYEVGNVGSIYFTVLVSLERYIVICHSLQARRFCTKKNALYASICVLLFTIFFNLPKIFATEIVSHARHPEVEFAGRHKNSPLDRTLPNMTIPIFPLKQNVTEFYIVTTRFGYSKAYNLYLQWGKIIFKYAIPYYWLIFFNFWIIWELRKSDKVRRKLVSSDCRQYQGGQLQKPGQNSTTSTTRMMLYVVAVFGISYLPLFIHEIFFRIPNYEPIQNSNELLHKSIRSSIIYSFVKLFATLNSSVNFIIYCILGVKFREVLKVILCSCIHFLHERISPGSKA